MLYRFAECELDAARVELRRGGRAVPVEPQVFSLLVFLIENRHRVLTKNELLDEIWAGRVVSDSALSSRIKAARQAVGDSGARQTVIGTMPKRGFRFVADVSVIGGTQSATALPHERAEEKVKADARRRICVLPFSVMGDDPGHQLLADGLTQDIITALGRTLWLSVIARGSSFLFRGRGDDPLAAARLLKADYVLSGTLQCASGRLRLRAALAETASGVELWAQNFDRPLRGIFDLQAELTETVAGSIQAEIQRIEQQRALHLPPEALDSWAAYHRGVWHMYRFAPVHLDHAERLFLRALEQAPSIPGPLAGLSFVHWQRAFLGATADRAAEVAQARRFADACLESDPADPRGYWALGRVLVLEEDVEGSVIELRRAVSFNPSSIMSLYSLARSLHFTGDLEESKRIIGVARSLSPFDPLTFAITAVQALNYSMLGTHEEAIPLIELSIRQPNAHYQIKAVAAFCHLQAGQEDKARLYLRRLQSECAGYSRDDYLRAFPYQRACDIDIVTAAFAELMTAQRTE